MFVSHCFQQHPVLTGELGQKISPVQPQCLLQDCNFLFLLLLFLCAQDHFFKLKRIDHARNLTVPGIDAIFNDDVFLFRQTGVHHLFSQPVCRNPEIIGRIRQTAPPIQDFKQFLTRYPLILPEEQQLEQLHRL